MIDNEKHNRIIALSFMLHQELTRGKMTTDEEVDLFLEYGRKLEETEDG